MTPKILYEFDQFRLDPIERTLVCSETPISLRAKSFDLLLALVESEGVAVSKEELIKRVWHSTFVTPSTFHVTLDDVRKALGESGRNPRFIRRASGAYIFVPRVRRIEIESPKSNAEEATEIPQQALPPTFPFVTGTLSHLLVGSCLYAAYYAVALILESVYQFDRFGSSVLMVIPIFFAGAGGSVLIGLPLDRYLTLKGKSGGLLASVLLIIAGAVSAFIGCAFVLPNFPVTESTLQSYPAQAAFLKDICYEFFLVVLFLVIPFHYVIKSRAKFRSESEVVNSTAGRSHLVSYWGFWALAALLLLLMPVSLAMTSRLLDHLKPGPYTNLFTILVYIRAALFFGLGIECLVWYRNAVTELRNKSAPDIRS